MKVRHFAILTVLIVASFASANSTVEIPADVAPSFTFKILAKGMPVKADVYLIDLRLGTKHSDPQRLRSNRFGLLEFRNLREGEYLLASRPEFPYAWSEYIRVTKSSDRKVLETNVETLLDPPPPLPIYAVKGRIIDASGAEISNATVVIEQFDTFRTPVAALTTASDGKFELKVDPGFYNLKIASPGFRLIVVPIQVVADPRRPHSLRVLLNVSPGGFSNDPYAFDVTPEQ